MTFDASAINSINTYNMLQTLLGSLYQVGFGAQTGSATGVGLLGNALGSAQNSQFLTNSFASQQTLNLSALNLSNAAAPLVTSALNSAFTRTSAASSNPSAVTAAALPNAEPDVLQVEVSQLAQGQAVAGAPADAFAPAGVTTGFSGYGQLEFTINGSAQDVTFKLNGLETNQEAFATIAAAINGRGIGVTASVAVDQDNNASLNLTGPTGAVNSFTVTDTLGNAAAFTGVGAPANVTQNAQNSEFTVNGVSFSNASNQPTLANTGLQLNLLQTTGLQAVDITIASNSSQLITPINNFVGAFNSTLSALQSSASPTSQADASTLATLAEANAADLQGIGVTVGAGGNLTVDQAQLQNALATQPGAVNSAFSGITGFAADVQSAAQNIINQSVSSTGNFNFANFYLSGFQSVFNSNSLMASNLGMFINNFV